MSLLIALILGVTCGALPIILGAIMEELEVGVLGFVASCVSALFFGLFGAIPISILCAFYIIRHARTKQFECLITSRKLFHSQLNDAAVLLAYNYKIKYT